MTTQKTLSNNAIGLPFVDHVDQQARPELTDVKAFLDQVYRKGGHHGSLFDMLKFGTLKRMGYKYDLKSHLTLYLVKLEHHGWSEMYAPNKTSIRNTCRGVIKILVLK